MLMPIARDYLEPTETQDANETKFVDCVLDGWGHWVRAASIDLRPTPAGVLWQVQAIIEAKDYALVLSDTAFLYVDRCVAVLPGRLKAIVFVEYVSSLEGPAKLLRTGLKRLAYRQRLHAAQWALVTPFGVELENWRQ